ncbi:MAG: hypothetical protein KatS3mg130_0173 [Candidatus Sumerlaea sp.]|nr:MAG: hypothetical protein KatS3mg130_0173 [Candidatus Sumerlaea sp.]
MPPWNVSSRSCLHAVDCTNAISSTIVRAQATAKYGSQAENHQHIARFWGSRIQDLAGAHLFHEAKEVQDPHLGCSPVVTEPKSENNSETVSPSPQKAGLHNTNGVPERSRAGNPVASVVLEGSLETLRSP